MLELTIRLVGETPEALAEYLEGLSKELSRLGELFKYHEGSKILSSGVVNYECEMQKLK